MRSSRNPLYLCIALFLLVVNCSQIDKNECVIEVRFPHGIKFHQIPVTIDLPFEYREEQILWEVIEEGREEAPPFFGQMWQTAENDTQRDRAHQRISFLWEPQSLTTGELKHFYLKSAAKVPQEIFRFEDTDEKRLHLYEDEIPVFTYNYGMTLKEGVPEDRRRSSYIHPVYGLDGEVLTDDFPEDHLHHRGIYWAWPHVTIGEESYDMWHIKGIYVRFEKWLGKETGPVFARFGAANGWYVGDKKVANDTVWVTAFRKGRVGQILDFSLTWEAIEAPIILLGADNKGYGGFNVRFAPYKEPIITTNTGIQEKSSDGLNFPWADLSAVFSGRNSYSGLAVFDNKGNINFPNTWTLRHYGFLNPSWPGLKPFTLHPGEPVSVNYRVLLHSGNAEEGKVSSAYTVYANPPIIDLLPSK